MKSLKLIIFLITSVLMLSLSSCNSCSSKKEEPQGPSPTKFEESMTGKDTLAVKQLVDKFFTYAKEKNFTEAAGMLYRAANDLKEEPQPLNNDEMAEVKHMLELFPMVDYRIEYIKFDEANLNEVLCYVIMRKADGETPEISTKMFFKPVNYMGNWLLCLNNTEYGDKGVVDPDKRDSVEKNFQKKEKAKAKTKEKVK